MKTVGEIKKWLATQPDDYLFAVPFGDYVKNKMEELLIIKGSYPSCDKVVASLDISDKGEA